MDAVHARHTLERLKRGVPPTSSIYELSIGMSGLKAKLDALLSHDANPRWFLVQSEYGEGKSHFHSFAREHALEEGYAVASLDVNNQEGALHQPQRHMAVVLDSLRSPQSQFREHQGFADIFRHWLETAEQSDVIRTLEKLRAIQPYVWAGRDPADLWSLSSYVMDSDYPRSSEYWFYPRLLRFFSVEDLVNKGSYARFAASFRLQIIQQWLIETGHKGLLLYIDEVDNVVRQIHAKAHPGCFRTIAWYCTCPAFPRIRVIFASTPEVIRTLDSWARTQYLHTLRSQITVTQEEVRVYEQWNSEAEKLSGKGWLTCPSLTKTQRKVLFERIARLFETAWNCSWNDFEGVIDELAARREYSTTRHWVKACVQLLDILQQDEQMGEGIDMKYGCAQAVRNMF